MSTIGAVVVGVVLAEGAGWHALKMTEISRTSDKPAIKHFLILKPPHLFIGGLGDVGGYYHK